MVCVCIHVPASRNKVEMRTKIKKQYVKLSEDKNETLRDNIKNFDFHSLT